jgi:molybdate transport repressor ModE-like protein
MDLRQLAALVAVADEGSFSAAARALSTVQSNVSTHVARLERELGAILVDRAVGGLTEEGEVVVERARRVQRELDALLADVSSLRDHLSGEVRLGCIGTVGRWLVPQLFPLLARRHPDVHVVVVDATTTSLIPQLEADTLDLAVLNLPWAHPDLASEKLFDEDRVLLVPRRHPLAELAIVELADLADHPLLLEPRGTPFRDELDAQAAGAGVELQTMAEVDGIRLLSHLAHDGFGPAVLPATAAPARMSSACRRIVIQGLTPRSVGWAHNQRSRLTAPARAVRDAIRDLVHTVEQPGVHPVDLPA